MPELELSLAHHGVKGQKWGVRRKTHGSVTAVHVVPKPGGGLSSSGGTNQPPHEDAVKNAVRKQLAKSSTTNALSTHDLRLLVDRMNLEQQYSKLAAEKSTVDKGHEKVKKLVSVANTLQQVHSFVNSPAGKALRKAMVGA